MELDGDDYYDKDDDVDANIMMTGVVTTMVVVMMKILMMITSITMPKTIPVMMIQQVGIMKKM